MAQIIGRLTVNNIEILEVDAIPSDGAGTVAPIGSFASFNSGTIGRLYMKAGAADTAWTQFDTQETDDWNLDGNELSGAAFNTPNEFFGSVNNYDLIFKRNNAEIMRVISEGLAIGLNSSIGGKLQVGQGLGNIVTHLQSIAPSGANVVRVTRQYKIQTVDETETTLIDLAIPETSRVQVRAYIGCNQHGGVSGSNGDGADYVRTASVKRLAGVSPTVEKWSSDFTSEDVKAFKVKEDIVNDNFVIQVKGEADRNIAWSAHVEYSIYLD